jgi:endonuclease III
MDSRQRAQMIYEALLVAIPDTKPTLNFANPFELLIGVILSAQTTDNQVNKVTKELFQRYRTPVELARATINEVESIVKSTGFFHNKARNIINTSAVIADIHAGGVPTTMEELTSLPGVGRKSANAVLGVCFGKPAIIVDTHFGRVVRRLELTEKSDPYKIEIELKALIPEQIQFEFSMLINRHGRQWCFARKPQCGSCPIMRHCPYERAS